MSISIKGSTIFNRIFTRTTDYVIQPVLIVQIDICCQFRRYSTVSVRLRLFCEPCQFLCGINLIHTALLSRFCNRSAIPCSSCCHNANGHNAQHHQQRQDKGKNPFSHFSFSSPSFISNHHSGMSIPFDYFRISVTTAVESCTFTIPSPFTSASRNLCMDTVSKSSYFALYISYVSCASLISTCPLRFTSKL